MTTFTKRLYEETKDLHLQVDRHPFVDLMRTEIDAGNIYINFNKICIYEMQKTIKINDNSLENKLHRSIEQPEMFITDSLASLLSSCKKFPLEHCYLFILGLLKGGHILKKYISPEHYSFLTFDNSRELADEFKNYIDNFVTDENDQNKFIDNVKNSYKLIKLVFDDFYETFTFNKVKSNKLLILSNFLDF